MNIAAKAAIRARAASVIPTPIPALTPGLRLEVWSFELDDIASAPFEAVGVGLKSVLDGKLGVFLAPVFDVPVADAVFVLAAVLDAEDELPVIAFQSPGDTA